MEEGEKLNFDNEIIEILAAQRETNCGNQVVGIVGKGGERKYELWQSSCRKWEEKKIVATKKLWQ